MKKILLTILFTLVLSGSAYAIMDRDKLAELMSKSYTDFGAELINEYCYYENARAQFLFSSRCKCAIKAAKSKNKQGVKKIGESCGLYFSIFD